MISEMFVVAVISGPYLKLYKWSEERTEFASGQPLQNPLVFTQLTNAPGPDPKPSGNRKCHSLSPGKSR